MIVVLKAKSGDSKEGIIVVDIPDAQPQNTLTAKHLQGWECSGSQRSQRSR